ncbi:hypothetical protein BCR36DRAFT_276254 [Piromyces finnis]|uniref:Right handed beta helix domain-containing protein n=1 Tax=Piromyces finnis TaxID=1754191 RepID=A0A1Y1VM32_9FUNG|nr:hypothetical protein BCR36DRAFT_276254 [Piromyces finnis]|eukprot:ORX59205.1 hypothetical protein BCR36DRAFT_276254 [Piromyces finnis]
MYIILKLFYLFSFIRIIRIVNGIDINNEKDFVENINNNKKEEQIFRIHNEIIINDKDILSPSIKNITIIGSTKEESIINFKNNDSINILFSKYCQSIFLKDITFIGNLQFIDNQNITFNNVNYNGYYIAEHTYEDEDNNSEIKVYDSNFILPNIRQGYEIKNWNIDIFRSNFYGNNQHEMYMIKFKSTLEQSNILKIDQTFFDGNFHNSALHCDYGSIIIYSSAFQKCYNGNNLKGGGAISFLNTDNTLYNITFENNYSDFAGGSIFLENTYSSNIDSINFYNSSSISVNIYIYILFVELFLYCFKIYVS